MLIWQTIRDRLEARRNCVLVTVFASRGSAPRNAGARMIVTADRAISGTIGGGALEWKAIGHCCNLAAAPGHRFEFRRFALGPELGQCCGGDVTLGFETFEPAMSSMVDELAARERAGPFATRGIVTGEGGLERTALATDKGAPPPATSIVKGGGAVIESFGDSPRSLYLFGAGHVGRALMLALAPLPFAVHWIDSRRDAFPSHMPAGFTACHLADPAAILAAAPTGAFVLVMTHSHALDLEIVSRALSLDRFAYVGLIGSASKNARFRRRLRADGLAGELVDRLVCPVGVKGITGKAPAVIAASIAAQLLQWNEAPAADDRLPTKPRAVLTA